MRKLPQFWGSLAARVFVERQMLLRSEDRVRSIRISARLQQSVAGIAALVLAWGMYSTAAYFLHGQRMAERKAELEDAKIAYFDLLAEVNEYQGEFQTIIGDLEANQTYLLSLLESDANRFGEVGAIAEGLRRSEDERARLALAREHLREELRKFEKDLLSVASRSASLENEVTSVRELLRSTQEERAQVAAARQRLGERLKSAQESLAATQSDKSALEQRLASVNEEVERVQRLRAEDRELVSEMSRQVASLETQLKASENRKSSLLAELEGVERQLAAARSRGEGLVEREQALLDKLARKDAMLADASRQKEILEEALTLAETSFSGAVSENAALAAERKELTQQVKSLRLHVAGMHQVQDELMSRLSARARSGVDMIERTVAMTGLDVDRLLQQVTEDTANQGGPFIPLETSDLTELGGTTSGLRTTAALLDSHMDRWEALQLVLASLPLAPPLDQYSLSSRYGKRKDPLNGRVAAHHGLDLSAPVHSPVYATAPGKVAYAGWRGRYGRLVEIDHGYGVTTRYAHLRSITVKPGEIVEHRQKIGTLGSSGRSTGPHVHYEVRVDGRPHDPMNFLQAGKNVFKN
jgi:murein DD-endopeptidase MepM/ murein hydrolase activator NlpD